MVIYNRILGRLPRPSHVAALYAVIIFAIYSWTLLWFFWKYPVELSALSIGKVLTVLASSLASNFFVSLAMLIVPISAAIIFPKKWFYDVFVARGVALTLPVLGYMMYVAWQFDEKLDPTETINLAPVVLAVTLLLVFAAGRPGFLRKALEVFADRATIFIYFSIPVSIIAIVVVAIQALF